MRTNIVRASSLGLWIALLLLLPVEFASAGEPFLVTPENEGKILGPVQVSRTSLNPSVRETVNLTFKLRADAQVTAKVFDPDQDLVAVLADGQLQTAGEHSLAWDGRDLDGNVVPDEAYFFTIEAVGEDGSQEIYDPTVFSGGEEDDLTKAETDPVAGTIVYRLPVMGRVRIRQGTEGGPLLNTLVDWLPRPAGQVTEYWDGKDRDKLFDLVSDPRFKMIITYFTLPENSVITFGNKDIDYFAYKRDLSRPEKETRVRLHDAERRMSRHYDIQRVRDRSPELVMLFPNKEGDDSDGKPVLKGKSLVRVELDEESRTVFQDTKFEIVFYLDGEFYAEEEVGYSPYTWVWDTSQVDEGVYTLTVNLSGFGDQIGVLSKEVKIVK